MMMEPMWIWTIVDALLIALMIIVIVML